jgi:preprotein translocase subunit SecE
MSGQERNIMAGIVNYVQESYNELKNHVTWTPLAEAQRLMVVVAVFSVVFALAIWGVDTVFSKVIEWYFDNVVKG